MTLRQADRTRIIIHAIAHNKVIIVDEEVVLTGSFNFTKAAEEKNAENLLVIHDKALAAKYQENWEIIESILSSMRAGELKT